MKRAIKLWKMMKKKRVCKSEPKKYWSLCSSLIWNYLPILKEAFSIRTGFNYVGCVCYLFKNVFSKYMNTRINKSIYSVHVLFPLAMLWCIYKLMCWKKERDLSIRSIHRFKLALDQLKGNVQQLTISYEISWFHQGVRSKK